MLKPGGTLAIVWNRRDPDCALLQRVKAITGAFRGDSPDHETIPWRDVFEAADSPLRLAGHETVPWEERIPLQRLKGRVSSVSFIALLDPEARAGVMRQLEELAGSPSDDAPVVLQYLTEVFLAKRRPER